MNRLTARLPRNRNDNSVHEYLLFHIYTDTQTVCKAGQIQSTHYNLPHPVSGIKKQTTPINLHRLMCAARCVSVGYANRGGGGLRVTAAQRRRNNRVVVIN